MIETTTAIDEWQFPPDVCQPRCALSFIFLSIQIIPNFFITSEPREGTHCPLVLALALIPFLVTCERSLWPKWGFREKHPLTRHVFICPPALPPHSMGDLKWLEIF